MNQAEAQLTMVFLTKHPLAGARVLESLSPEKTANVLTPIPAQVLAQTLQHLLPNRRFAILQYMPEELALDILTHMTPSSAFKTLQFANQTWRAGFLAKMDVRQSASILKAFSYIEGSAGRFANPDVLTLTGDRTVSDVIQWIQSQKDHTTHEVYVVDRHQKLLGCVSVQELLIADLDDSLKKIAKPAEQTLSSNWSLEEIFTSSLWLTKHTLPVVEADHIFLGVISYSSLLSIQLSKQRATLEITEQASALNPARTPNTNGKSLPHFITPTTSPYTFDQKQQHPDTDHSA